MLVELIFEMGVVFVILGVIIVLFVIELFWIDFIVIFVMVFLGFLF